MTSSAVGKWLVDPCGSDLGGWLAFIVLLVTPPLAALLFSLPGPAMLRYVDNCVVGCLASPVALEASIDHYGEACGSEIVAGIGLINAFAAAVLGSGIGALVLRVVLRREPRMDAS